MESQYSIKNRLVRGVTFTEEEYGFSFPNDHHLPPLDQFGYPELGYNNVGYDFVTKPSLEQHQNGLDVFACTPTDISWDPFNASLDIVPRHNNQCLLPDSFTNAPADDFINVNEFENGFSSPNQEIMPMMNSWGFQNYNQPLMITNTEDNNGGQIIDTKPMNDNNNETKVEEMAVKMEPTKLTSPRTQEKERPEIRHGGGSNYTSKMMLTRETISSYFYMPITQAAKELNVGLTLLKKRCRELGIRRWPHRKLMSLQTLINNVQELNSGEKAEGRLRDALMLLERERKKMEEIPDLQLEHNTKKLRQACFKANYKKRRTMGMMTSMSSLTSLTGQPRSLSSCSSTCSVNPKDYEAVDNDYGDDEEQVDMRSMLFSDCLPLSSNTSF